MPIIKKGQRLHYKNTALDYDVRYINKTPRQSAHFFISFEKYLVNSEVEVEQIAGKTYRGFAGETETEAEGKLSAYFKSYIDRGVVTKKVIMIEKCDQNVSYETVGRIVFDYTVMTKTVFNGETSYVKVSEEYARYNSYVNPKEYIELEWTQEREDECNKIVQALMVMQKKIEAFVSDKGVEGLLSPKTNLLLLSDK